ncbi:hypothetical protein ElyMa_005264400 [Elysia marginata]|uniref:Sfi1 spindle body domain-containing protein n=1 Tax=Elysia marginata TaxID=1093978 RepID=A0AAV4JX71_9GAST|nr:hypothetical protein ElyMa_005264400 [Elysia marginata]
MVRTARQWQRFVLKRKLCRQTDAENLAMAVRHHERSLSRKTFRAIKTEVAVSKLAQKHRILLCYKYARMWKAKVDYSVTARAVDRENAVRRVWLCWRIEYKKRCAAQKVVINEKKYLLNMIIRNLRGFHLS